MMREIEHDLLGLSVVASGPVTAGRAVGFDGAQIAAVGAKPLGVAVTRAAAGEACRVVAIGTAIVEAGAAVAVGDSLICDAQGRAIPTITALGISPGATPVTSSAALGPLVGTELPDYVFGDAMTAAAASGDKIKIILRR